MARRSDLSPVVDGILRLAALGGLMTTALLAPNAVQLLDKPIQKYFKDLDERSRQREMKNILTYMHRQGLVSDNYEHGLRISPKAKKRLEKADLDAVSISKPAKWDHKWRIIFYDIPEKHKTGRDNLAYKLRRLGCQQLQRSVWIHPFPCEKEINIIAIAHNLQGYITYLETVRINNEEALLKRFDHLF